MDNKARIYLDFLQSPNTTSLSEDASLNYITTTTSIHEPVAILKHLSAQAKQVVKKEEKVTGTIEGESGVCLETVITLQFHEGGGAYLPGIDSNLVDERMVIFPLTHVVNFSDSGKIQQIRLYWDQGTLLKQVEAIGKSGRNWPIRDGKAQGEMLMASAKSMGSSIAAQSGGSASRGGDPQKKRDSVSVTRDPHASLALFNERDPNENAGSSYDGPKLAPRASARPAARDMSELFVGEETATTLGSTVRSPSPHKDEGVTLKSGAGKHHTTNRIFEDDDEIRSPERKKTYGQKYEHFTFGDGEDAPKENRPATGKAGKINPTSFSFEDFSTPLKVSLKARPDYERHWGSGVDPEDPGSPPKRPVVHAPRPDIDPHFSLGGESPLPTKPTSQQRQRSPNLSQDLSQSEEPANKNTGLHVNNNRRGDDFGAHYSMTDDQPSSNIPSTNKAKRATRSDMEPHWGFSEPAEKEKRIYKTAGDGMGGRSGAREWGIGDDSDPDVQADIRRTTRSRRVQADAGANF